MIGTDGTLTPAKSAFFSAPKLSSQSRRRNTYISSSVQTAPPPPVYTCKPTNSLYDVLKVNRNASTVEIKSAYRNLAKVYHPDSLPLDSSDGRDFIEIHEAYSTLSDPSSRAIYDLNLTVGSLGNRMNVGDYSGYNRTRRWETDQCW